VRKCDSRPMSASIRASLQSYIANCQTFGQPSKNRIGRLPSTGGSVEILAGLVQLDQADLLPAPWFNRPSLGLVTNTAVKIGVLKAIGPTEAPPDILVTPLRTDRLHCTVSIIIDLKEHRGAVYEALRGIKDTLNIALAETVTIDQRTRHRITLILEPKDFSTAMSPEGIATYQKDLEDFKTSIEKVPGYLTITPNYVVDESTRFEKQDTSSVQWGTIEFKTIRDWFVQKYVNKFSDRFDFNRVIVSSNAEGRFIRYIFPKRGVFEATVSHLDVPTALAKITSVLHDLEYNILLSRLSRSAGALPKQEKSKYVAICEPRDPPEAGITSKKYADDVAAKIIEKLNDCEPEYEIALEKNKVSLGVSIGTVAYPYKHGMNPATREIVAPHELRYYLEQYRMERKKTIFLSYSNSLNNTPAGSSLLQCIIGSIEESGAVVYDGFSRPRPLHDDHAADVRARMWMASAAIFIASDRDAAGNLSENQLIEWGFIYGQGKRWLVVVKDGDENKVHHFMTPEVAFVTYKDLSSTLELKDVARRVSNAIVRWFPQM
jgi:hypothetical protein